MSYFMGMTEEEYQDWSAKQIAAGKAFHEKNKPGSAEMVAKFAVYISDLNFDFQFLGIDSDTGIRISEYDGRFSITVDCSDTFMWGCSDNENISNMEELELFIKISEWFKEEHLPHIHNGREYDFFSEEAENEYAQWVGKAYCYVIREGKEDFISWHQERYPEWLRKKLEAEVGK